jgi:hypothetical protein
MKKLAFSVIATVFMSVLSVNAQSGAPKNFLKLDVGFGRVSSYAGPCVSASGMCSGSIGTETSFQAGIAKVSESEVSYAFSKSFYEQNISYLKNGLYVSTIFSLPRSISEKIGLQGEFVVAKGTYNLTEKDGYYYLSLARVR